MKLWFMSKTKFFIILSCAIVLAGVVAYFIFGGLKLGIDFTGGSIFTVEMGSQFSDEDINAALSANGIEPAASQIVHGGNNNTAAIIRMKELPTGTDAVALRQSIISSLSAKYPSVTAGEIENVGGVTSSQIVMNAFLSILIASVLMLIYIWVRFTFYSGIGGVIALVHDVFIMTAFVCIARIEINSSYIAACLTILGYSINDTIVVFDRIRENNKRYSTKQMSRWQIGDLSIRETLPRTINTSLTVLITTLAVYIFGVQSIKDFTLPLLVGIVSGTYSSIFIATPIWLVFENRRDRRLQFKPAAQKSKV
jgi:preprotein translocase subunit SecF